MGVGLVCHVFLLVYDQREVMCAVFVAGSGGTMTACPSGRYRTDVGATDVSGCTICPAGSFCVTGSQTPLPCGNDEVHKRALCHHLTRMAHRPSTLMCGEADGCRVRYPLTYCVVVL